MCRAAQVSQRVHAADNSQIAPSPALPTRETLTLSSRPSCTRTTAPPPSRARACPGSRATPSWTSCATWPPSAVRSRAWCACWARLRGSDARAGTTGRRGSRRGALRARGGPHLPAGATPSGGGGLSAWRAACVNSARGLACLSTLPLQEGRTAVEIQFGESADGAVQKEEACNVVVWNPWVRGGRPLPTAARIRHVQARLSGMRSRGRGCATLRATASHPTNLLGHRR